MAQLNPLRPITQRLNSTPVSELPRYAGFLATAISNCAELLWSSEGQQKDESVQVHKLTTRVASLLQDKTQEGRFTGVVLVKALIEVVHPQTLAKSGAAWVRNLLSCLNKNDPPQVKKLSIIAITRIFLLSKDNQTMVREVTTPSLVAFLNACVNLIKPVTISKDGLDQQMQSSLLPPVLECWAPLLKTFPSTFRPYVNSIRAIALSLLSQHISSPEVRELVFCVYASLHFCAPKDNLTSEWLQSVRLIIEAAHQTADLIFRSVLEEWSSAIPRQRPLLPSRKVSSEVQAPESDAVGLDKWVGIQTGTSRAVHLLQLLDVMLNNQHAGVMNLPLAEVLDLTARFASVLVPSQTYSLRENKEIGREEREELFTNLPRLHSTVLQLHGHMASALGRALIPVSQTALSQFWDMFESGSSSNEVRTASYRTMEQFLQHSSIVLRPRESEHIANLVRKCLVDIQIADERRNDPLSGQKENQNGTLNVDLHQQSRKEVVQDQWRSENSHAAWNLLPVLLSHIPAMLFTSKVRAEIDRHAILLGHEQALLASVLNPQPPRKGAMRAPSVLPFLGRTNNGELALEALLRPRMPVLQEAGRHDIIDTNEVEESTTAEDAVLPEAIIQPIAEGPGDELKSDFTEHTPPNSLIIKKREHAAVEEASTPAPLEPSKRVRINTQQIDAGMKTGLLETSGAEQIEPDSSSLVDTKGAMRNESLTAKTRTKDPASIVNVTDPFRNYIIRKITVEDDSDDSDIPQIDTALSSDEEEDEGEEM